ncbi:MAG: hypothetical protein ABI954_04125 [Pyrinomonadaceae bacterium]
MFCPKCGKGEQIPNAYCRACGEWLPDVNNLSRHGRVKLPPEKRLKITLIFNLLSAIFAIISAIVLITSFPDDRLPGVAIAIPLCLAITAWQIVGFILTFQLRQDLKRRRQGFQASSNQLNTSESSDNALPPANTSQFVRPFASVTENTTSLLEPIQKKTTNKFD